jgi:hypothetical protein
VTLGVIHHRKNYIDSAGATSVSSTEQCTMEFERQCYRIKAESKSRDTSLYLLTERFSFSAIRLKKHPAIVISNTIRNYSDNNHESAKSNENPFLLFIPIKMTASVV